MATKNNWVFFGTSRFSVIILEELKKKGSVPNLIITVPDKPKGRKLILTPPETKIWAEKENIPVIQPKTLRTPEVVDEIKKHSSDGFDFFIVASYGKIIPQSILDIPVHGTLNVHPSLLPLLRGPSPIQSAILTQDETGVTIIKLDAEMDHGPIVAQEKVVVSDWPPYAEDLEEKLAVVGGEMLAKIIPDWILGTVKEQEQDHSRATLCQKIEKEDAEIDLNENADANLRKIRAYHAWPGAYYFEIRGETKKRIIVKRAHLENGELIIDRIVPEGKKEMSYADYQKGKRG